MQLHRDREKFEEAGVSLVVIGQGEPEDAARFKESQRVEGLNVLTDSERASYKAAGTKKGTFGELLGPGVMARGLKSSITDKVRQGRTVGHPAQLGGVLVVAPGDRITWAHLSDDASDLPPNDEVLEAAREAASQG